MSGHRRDRRRRKRRDKPSSRRAASAPDPPSPQEGIDDGILDLAHLERTAELRCKRDRVVRALQARSIRAELPLPEPSPRREGARARIRLRVTPEGRLVMHRRASHTPVEPPLRRMARPELARAALGIQEILCRQPALARGLRTLELRSDGQRVVAAFQGQRPQHDLGQALAPAVGEDGAVAMGARGLHGDPRIELQVCDLALRFGPQSFYQVNLEVNQLLADRILAWVTLIQPSAALDLFGGAGNLSLPLAARGIAVTLLESHPPAVADAKENASRLGLAVDVRQADATALTPGEHFYDLALLDPPRKGAQGALARACVSRPRAIILVSCHPPAFAKDLQEALSAGYALEQVALFDLFPLTSHVESVALLRRA